MTKPDVATYEALRKMTPRKRRMLAFLARQDDDERFTRQDIARRVLRKRSLNRHAIRELEELVSEYWVYRRRVRVVDRVATMMIYPTYTGKQTKRRPAMKFRWHYEYYVGSLQAPMLRAALRPKHKSTRRPAQQPRRVMYSSRWAWLKHILGFWK